jgi:hypothetical protein
MHLSYTFPNPLARLTGLLEAVAHARSTSETQAIGPGKAMRPQVAPQVESLERQAAELDRLSLDGGAGPVEARADDLEGLSLSREEAAPTDPSERLLDHGLCRRRSRRRRHRP